MSRSPEATSEVEADALLEVRDLKKSFGGVAAVSDGSLSVLPGEVHVLLGSNGCGKSTLCKIVAGALMSDAGEIFLKGKPVSFANPLAARAAGIGTVYQETSLIPTLTVAENLLLGAEPTTATGLVDRRAMRARSMELLETVGRELAHGIRSEDFIAKLSIDQHQVVEILRVVGRDPDIVIFDEATASLDRAQVEAFFGLVRELRAKGKAIIFITHRMEEIFAIGDRVTVMRNGRSVATLRTAETSKGELVRLMVGEDAVAAQTKATPSAPGETVLEVEGLSGPVLSDVSLRLAKGEILGLGGLHGQGQSSLLLSLFGVEPIHSGRILLGGKPARIARPSAALKQRLAYISGDRGRVGAFAIRSVFENLALVRLQAERSFVVRYRRLATHFAPIIERLKIRFASLSAPISSLSGGNQQKVIIGRWLAAEPTILLLDDTTKGIDIRAKQDFYALLDELRREGLSVILYSSEDAELLESADRILVFNNGRIVGELSGGTKTEYELYAAALKSA